jgi:phthiocerol/phenolphthiocerol synthesis type-I polyketide synthase B
MTPDWNEETLRQWLVDYLVDTLECSGEQIEHGASMHDLGVGSRDAVVLTGRLGELLGRVVSPVEFWQYPTVTALARFLTGGEVEPVYAGAGAAGPRAGGRDQIAVIGVGCRFPGGVSGLDGLWDFLAAGESGVREVPRDRWSRFADGSPGDAAVIAATTRWGGYLEDVAEFDAEFFEIPAGEADKMDPQQRLLLEVTSEALDDAGIPADSLAETRTGVFAGACSAEYWPIATADLTAVDAWSATGGAPSIIANRLSYFFDFRGPSVTVDTACSSSLVAVHMACQSLRSGESDVALAAGVNVLLTPAPTRSFDVAEVLSRSGGCHAFDASADGFVRSEGAGVVVLKRLSDALRDGDRVLAVVRGSAVNQDGRSNGLMAPNPAAQMAVLRAAYADAGVDARDVDYVEAHGTGTLLGDPIEARALGMVLGKGRPADDPLLIGSVKSNLGHMEAAAGIAGLAKAVLAVSRGVVPANLDYRNPNPHIPFAKLRLKVVAEPTPWPAGADRRIAGVSSFGFGGTNAHVVIESAPEPEPQPESAVPQPDSGSVSSSSAVSTLVVSGKTPERVSALAATLADWMDAAGAGVALDEVAHTLNHHRSHHPVFATVCARDRAQAAAGLAALAAGRSEAGVVAPHAGRCRPGTVFVYSGQGSQWVGMGRQLLADEPAFAAAVDELEPAFVEQVGYSLRQVLADGEEVRGDARVQPVVMGLQLALTALWRSYGVHPDAVIGHSMGEVSAAVVAGALTPAQGFAVIAARSRLMAGLAGQGAVALLDADSAATGTLIADYPGVEIAGYLSPRQTVVAGPVAAVEALLAAATAANRFARRVNMEVASHTALMDPVCETLRAELAGLTPRVPGVRMISTVTDPAVTPALDADYWVANVRRPVQFHQAVSAAAVDHGTFIEISPNPILTHSIDDTLTEVHHHALPTLVRDGDDTCTFHTSLNATHTNHPPLTPHRPEPHIPLPATPWSHSTHWVPEPPPRLPGERITPSGHPVASVVPADWVCELHWPPSPLVDEPAGADTHGWLVIADGEIGAEIGRRIGGEAAVTVVRPAELADDPDAVIAELTGVTHVLYAPEAAGPGAAAWEPAAGRRIFTAARTLAVAMADRPLPPTLIMLTRNAAPIDAGDRANPAHAVLWGLGRTLALEHPEIWGRVIDVDESVPARIAADWVLAEVNGGGSEDQVCYRAGVRRVARLRRTTAAATGQVRLDPGGSHLVVGATGNIGPHLIGYLAGQGATTIVAVSRNPGTRLDGLAETLSQRGIRLVSVAADASDEAALSALFDRFGTDLPPLAGVYLAAFGGGPTTLRDMTDGDVSAMFAPKLDAAWLLHTLSSAHPVRQFVLFTSISGLLGSRWLGHYAATTTFLDTFAYARRAAGLPATAVEWGWWKSLADNQSDSERQVTLDSGLLPMPDDTAIRALSVLTGPDAPVCCAVVAADWNRLAGAYRTRASLRIVDELTTDSSGEMFSGATGFRADLAGCEAERRHLMLTDHVCALVAEAMGIASPQLLDRSAGFFQSGMNSLMSVALRRSLSDSLGEELPASVIFDYPTVDQLVGYLAAKLPETATLIDTSDGGDDGGDYGDDYGDLAEDELLQQLSERLS